MSREKILAALKQNQPEVSSLPAGLLFEPEAYPDLVRKFRLTAEGIGSTVYEVNDFSEIPPLLISVFSGVNRIVSMAKELVSAHIPAFKWDEDPHTYADVDVAIFKPVFGVAENSSLWITEDLMGVRALPFITQHIVMLVDKKTMVPDMHAAYEKIGDADYGFGSFIAGPSKTADIEQSLVLGAHGPRSMTIFLY